MGLPALDIAFDRLHAVDSLVAKVARLSEVARIARKETALREYLLASWEKTARQAARAAGLRAGKQGATAKRVERIVREIMAQWAEDVLPRHLRTVREMYRLARIAGWKKATKQTTASLAYTTPNFTEQEPVKKQAELAVVPTFDLVDERAVAALTRHQVFWVGKHYERNVSDAIAETAREVIVETGEHPEEAAALMRERVQEELGRVRTPKGWHGSARQYFEGLAANAATTARAHGQLRSFQEYGITRYEWMSLKDARMCEVCGAMNGRVFTVEQGAGIMEAEQAAKTPAQVRAAHPFLRPKHIARLHTKKPGRRGGGPKDNAMLARGGFAMPPAHFRCFLEGTLVWTRQGLRPIEAIQIGDEVLTHRLRWRRVTATFASDYQGGLLRIGDVGSTEDHPYLLNRGDCVIFGAVVAGDRLARVKENLDNLRSMREGISCDALPYQDPPLLLGEVQEDESGQSSSNSAQKEEEAPFPKKRADYKKLREMREGRQANAGRCEGVSFLFSRMPVQNASERELCQLFGMRDGVLAYSCFDSSRRKNVFFQMSDQEMEEIGLWPKRPCRKGTICRREESDVRQVSRAWEMGHSGNSLARNDSCSEFLGRSGCQHVLKSGREIPLRAEKISAQRQDDLPSRFLPSKTGFVGGGQGLALQTSQRRDCETVPPSSSLDRSEEVQAVEFIPVNPLIYSTGSIRVRNLTVEEDESFVVGRLGLIAHNCRCTVEVTTRAGSWTP